MITAEEDSSYGDTWTNYWTMSSDDASNAESLVRHAEFLRIVAVPTTSSGNFDKLKHSTDPSS